MMPGAQVSAVRFNWEAAIMTTVPGARRGTAPAARADGLVAWAEASGPAFLIDRAALHTRERPCESEVRAPG
jgi:hypothetical protein